MLSTLFIILNLILLESLLSIDNAGVLAIMVHDLPDRAQKNKALSYGIWGAYLLRGLCLFFAAHLVAFWPIKIVGGLYLLWLCISHFTPANDSLEEPSNKDDSKIFKLASYLGLNRLWATIVLVEVMDLAFSMDNIFAAVALTDKFWAIIVGVFIGIAAMRFVAQKFVVLMEKYPSLGSSAYVVIGLLGIKLAFMGLLSWSWVVTLSPSFVGLKEALESHTTQVIFSLGTLVVFLAPLLSKKKVVITNS